MKKDLFKNLPSEITISILSRLPVRNIAISKCVCKPWLDLLKTGDFVNAHLSKSVPSLVLSLKRAPYGFQVYEVDAVESHDFVNAHLSKSVTNFVFPRKANIVGAANGLLLLKKVASFVNRTDYLYICNPITREYVELCRPKEEYLFKKHPPSGAYGFGASRISGQHKVVRINYKSECSVYTLETGSWRRVAVDAARASLLHHMNFPLSSFVDGHLYWRVTFSASPLITCFDLETECFSSFDAPASRGDLCVVRGCLCFCEVEDEIVVLWLMKEKSWRKEYVIKIPGPDGFGYRAWPINVFKNGDMLMLCNYNQFIHFYNFNKTKAIQEIGGILTPDEFLCSTVFSLSFLSLKGLGMANVITF